MFPKYALTEADRDRLSKMLKEWEDRAEQNIDQRMNEGEPSAPDVYLARAGDDGVPALTTDRELGSGSFGNPSTGTGTHGFEYTGTGVFGDGWIYPGYALADIYALDRTRNAIQRGKVKTETVYNLGEEIPVDSWMIVSRDRAGIWWVVEVVKSSTQYRAQMLKGKLNTTLERRSSATMRIWQIVAGVLTDSGEDVVVYSWMLAVGQRISAGKEIMAHWDATDKVYYVGNGECP